jgi:pilus assembly protein FimV
MNSLAYIHSSWFKRSTLCAALALSLVGNAQALTLSRPQVQSKQGEALRAEIDIIDLIPSEEVELQAGLASPEAYRAARMELPRSGGTPIDVQVQLQRRPDGRPYLKISSPQAINSNFIDLLLVLQWATGRSLRDVSLSLDDGRTNSPKTALPLLMPADLQNSSEKTPARAPLPPLAVAAPMAAVTTPLTKDDQRVGVQEGDTAGQIAKENLASGASLDQMLLAMLRGNPNAFVESNVNRLKTGALITLPSAQEATSVSREEARKAIQIQAEDFREYRARMAGSQLGGEAPKASRASDGKLDAQVINKAANTEDKLTLTKPGKDAPEAKIAKQLEVQDVASRASEISQNMADLSKLVAAATASSASEPAAVSANVVVPEPAQGADEDTLKVWMSHPLAPLGAGGLVSIMAIIGLWLSRGRRSTKDDQPEAIKPLNVNFDLDLPKFDNDPNQRQDPSHEDSVVAPEPEAHNKAETPEAPVASTPAQPAVRPTMTMPSVSLDLDLASEADPFLVRMDLAEELWKLGQHHTSRALMEEVMQESNGATQAKAKQWLADRA